MHPPFIFTDHKIGPDHLYPGDTPKPVKRSKPETLILRPMAEGWPPVPLVVPQHLLVQNAPSGHPLERQFQLRVVPDPRKTWRDTVGRWLIRLGQRMILENTPG